jgi:hypothetical protein
MELHTMTMTVLTHPLQGLCVGMVIARGVHAVVAGVRERWQLRPRSEGHASHPLPAAPAT